MRYVYEIYRQKSFSKAAQALFITQPALSIAIGKLEASLGMPLFDRSTRPISLTPAGRIYLQTIEQTRALDGLEVDAPPARRHPRAAHGDHHHR